MSKYIDADIVKTKIRRNLMPNVGDDGMVSVENAERWFLKLLDEAPTVEPNTWEILVVVGEWFDKWISTYKDLNRKASLDGDRKKFDYSFALIENLKIYRELLLAEIKEKCLKGSVTDEFICEDN